MRKPRLKDISLLKVIQPQNSRLAAIEPRTIWPQALYSDPSQVAEKLEMLKKQYDEKLAQKEELRKKSEEMELKLERAGMLVSGLAGEKARWEETVKVREVVPPGSPSSLPTSSKSSHPL